MTAFSLEALICVVSDRTAVHYMTDSQQLLPLPRLSLQVIGRVH